MIYETFTLKIKNLFRTSISECNEMLTTKKYVINKDEDEGELITKKKPILNN